jgi:hypothetical protein
MFLCMIAIPPRREVVLARRIATGLPVWAVARDANLPPEDLGALMWEPRFREMVGSWAEIIDMDPEARKRRLLMLARLVLEASLAAGDRRTALLVQREYRYGRDPVVNLAEGFSHIVDREQARADRQREALEAEEAARAQGAAAPAPKPSPVEAAVVEAEVARRFPATAHPDDRAVWRKAGELRRQMFEEQVLHHAVVRKAQLDRLLGPPSVADLGPEAAGEPEAPPRPAPRSVPVPPKPPRAEPPIQTGKRAASAAAEMSDEDREVMDELRDMFFDLSKERLAHLFSLPPKGMEHIYAALAREAAGQGGRLRRRPRSPP